MKIRLLSPLLLVLAPAMASAQSAPDAGRMLLEQREPLALPQESQAPVIERGEAVPATKGGSEVTLQEVTFEGNSLYSSQELEKIIGPVIGNSYDMAGLKEIAQKISDHYHDAGYPFARALIPQQKLENGKLVITIIEGRYGKIKATGSANDAESAQAYLSDLVTGSAIYSPSLERDTLILSDQPGVTSAPIIRPGQDAGTGDLNVPVSRKTSFGGDVGADNNGNRYSGEYRTKVNFNLDSPFLFGDQILARFMVTEEKTWLGSASYSLPIGASGLRGQVGYYETQYTLGKQFENLDAHGHARVATVGVNYPLIRTQPANLYVNLTYQHKILQDSQDTASTVTGKNSDSAPLSAQFDLRDTLLGGGLTYGVFSWTMGRLNLDGDLKATDDLSAKTDGTFHKFNLDVVRIQKLPEDFTLFARFSGQAASRNLDSSESFGLGGNDGVRAYPSGEGYGDEGVLGQVELRYTVGAFSPFAFYDTGYVRLNTDPWDNAKNYRVLAGPGFGLRAFYKGFSASTSLAWATVGGDPQSDTDKRTPRVWFTIGYRY